MTRVRIQRILDLSLAAMVVAGSAAGWSCSKKDKAGDGAGATYTIWDPYPQFDSASGWVQLLNKCGSDAGVAIKRVAFDTTDLTSKALLAAQQGNSPDVLIVDNPVVSTLADAGVLSTTDETRTDTSAVQPNLLAAGQLGGKT